MDSRLARCPTPLGNGPSEPEPGMAADVPEQSTRNPLIIGYCDFLPGAAFHTTLSVPCRGGSVAGSPGKPRPHPRGFSVGFEIWWHRSPRCKIIRSRGSLDRFALLRINLAPLRDFRAAGPAVGSFRTRINILQSRGRGREGAKRLEMLGSAVWLPLAGLLWLSMRRGCKTEPCNLLISLMAYTGFNI